MKRLFMFSLLAVLSACGKSGNQAGKPLPAEYLGIWVHDETYINPTSDRFTRRRFTLRATGDSAVLENWYGISVKSSGQETALSQPSQLGCQFNDEVNGVLCGSSRWAGADTLRLQADGMLRVSGRAYPKALFFQKKN